MAQTERKRTKKSGQNNKNINLAIVAAALVLIITALLVFAFSSPKKVDTEELKDMRFLAGISIAGIDVSDKTISQAEPLIREKAVQLLDSMDMSYTVNGQTYPVTPHELGAYVDHVSIMAEAMMFARSGAGKGEQKAQLENGGVNFDLKVSVDRQTAASSLKRHGQLYNTEPVNATMQVETSQNSETLQCSGEIVFIEDIDGLTVDENKLADELCAMVESGDVSASVTAYLDVTEADITLAELRENCQLMGEFSTTFKSSAYGRRFNIWKMSTVVNGVVLEPGEQWSINEAAGPRTTENGWADAKGIKGGAYVDEPGGGICQVSTTLYGAILRSELAVVERKHHSWPSDYVPVGLDATISTGAPDFIYKNNTDYPIVVIANTDAKDERTVKVSVYGPPLDYVLDFTSTIVKETEPEPIATTVDPSMSPGASAEIKPRRIGKIAEVYKHYYDKVTGEEIREPELIYTDTYGAFQGLIAYGPSPDPLASAGENAAPSASAGEPAPSPSASPEVSAEPQSSNEPQTEG